MARDDGTRFEVKLGRMRAASGHERVTGFLKSVSRSARRRGSRGRCRNTRQTAMAFHRRVMVKVSVVRMDGHGAGAQRQHLKYIRRDSAAPEEERCTLYDRDGRDVDVKAFEAGGKDDRHQFRLIVSPEDSPALSDLTSFTRDLMREMETDLGTKLDWVAADHYDTAQPHTHIVIRGKREDGRDLVMPRNYIAHGIRERAQALVEIELGPVNPLEGRQRWARMVTQNRLTELDRSLLARTKAGIVDLSGPVKPTRLWRRRLEHLRLKNLTQMGLAEPLGKGRWRIAENARQTLQRMGERKDIIKTMHRAMAERGLRRLDGSSFYDPSADTARPMTGRIAALGVADDVADSAFLVIDSLEGRAVYADIGPSDRLQNYETGQIVTLVPPRQEPRPSDRTLAKIAVANAGRYSPSLHMEADPSARPEFVEAHVRRLEALRRAGHVTRHQDGRWTIPEDYLSRAATYERILALSQPLTIQTESALKFSQMRQATGATWLDRHMMARESQSLAQGFGAEVAEAARQRRQFLVREGFLTSPTQPTTSDTLDQLRRHDLSEAGARLSQELGKPYRAAPRQGRIKGTYRGAIDRPSGRFAIIEQSKEFSLVPWRDVLDRQRGKVVSGLIRKGGVSWRFGKTLGVS